MLLKVLCHLISIRIPDPIGQIPHEPLSLKYVPLLALSCYGPQNATKPSAPLHLLEESVFLFLRDRIIRRCMQVPRRTSGRMIIEAAFPEAHRLKGQCDFRYRPLIVEFVGEPL